MGCSFSPLLATYLTRVRVRVRVRVKVRVRVRVRDVALVLEVEALGQVEVALDGRALPLAADGVGDLDVDLRPVEGAAALVHLVVPPLALECSLERLGRRLPDLVRSHGLVRFRV